MKDDFIWGFLMVVAFSFMLVPLFFGMCEANAHHEKYITFNKGAVAVQADGITSVATEWKRGTCYFKYSRDLAKPSYTVIRIKKFRSFRSCNNLNKTILRFLMNNTSILKI